MFGKKKKKQEKILDELDLDFDDVLEDVDYEDDYEDGYEDEYADDYEDDVEEEDVKEKPRRKKDKDNIIKLRTGLPFFYKFMIGILVVIIIFAAAFIFLSMKCKIKTIKVVGNTWNTDEEIIGNLKQKFYDDYSVFFKLHYTLSDAPEMAFVDKFVVEMDSLDTITIKVYEKSIVGCVRIMDDYMYFDKNGYIVASRSGQLNNVPSIDGLIFTEASVGKVLQVQDNSVYAGILEVTQLINKYKIGVDSISFDSENCITLKCSDKNEIYLGSQKTYDIIMQAIPGILEAAEQKPAYYRLDMSEFSAENTTIKAEFLENIVKNN